jgi:transcriptional regulator of acetoin/glycerol metabolism
MSALIGEFKVLVTIEDGRVKTLEEIAREQARAVLRRQQGNVGEAAKLLGIHPATFYRRFRDLIEEWQAGRLRQRGASA